MSEKIGVKRWYTVQVMSGQENRVVESLTNRHQRNLDNGVDDGMEELLLPTKKVIERKDKKEYVRQQKSFPGLRPHLRRDRSRHPRVLAVHQGHQGCHQLHGRRVAHSPLRR